MFGVYKTSGSAKVTEITTDSDGEALCELEPGGYYLRELKAPSGYVLESVSIPFTVKVDSTVRVEVTNMRQQSSGSVKLVKRGPDGEAVSDAVFGIYKASDNAKVNSELHAGKIRSYIVLALALNHQALTQKSASSKKPQVENEKFAMRVYLNRIGFIGQEFKNCREHLCQHLSGNSAWRYRVGA